MGLAAMLSASEAIGNFKNCLECLYVNRKSTDLYEPAEFTKYYCEASDTCRDSADTNCGQLDIIQQPEECMMGVEPCKS